MFCDFAVEFTCSGSREKYCKGGPPPRLGTGFMPLCQLPCCPTALLEAVLNLPLHRIAGYQACLGKMPWSGRYLLRLVILVQFAEGGSPISKYLPR